MRNTKLYTALLLSLLLLLTPAYAKADGSNTVNTHLSVSDTTVTSGTTVTCTITVTNTDTTYGADIAVSYNGQTIDSYYLNAGQTDTTVHPITIYKTTDVFYTVYASHGPDLSMTKDTNTVTVYVEEQSTPTPTPTPTHTPSAAPNQTVTPTSAPTAVITQVITPEITPSLKPDKNLGWGEPIKIDHRSLNVMENIFKENPADWLGIGQETKGDYEYIYTMRRIIAAIAAFIVLSLAALIIAAIRILKK